MMSGNTFTFSPNGDTTMNIPVNTETDMVAEGNETFLLNITSVTGPAVAGIPSQSNITIEDDDRITSSKLLPHLMLFL